MTDNAIFQPNSIVEGPIFPEPIEISMTVSVGEYVKIIGKGLKTGQFYDPVLSPEQLETLRNVTPNAESFDGDAFNFRLGIEALRLGIAYEYDPFFSLSIARVDPLPHQLEAVYDYFLKLPRIRFLLADDPGAGKTIMAGLLVKELKIRGLILDIQGLQRRLQRRSRRSSDRPWYRASGRSSLPGGGTKPVGGRRTSKRCC